MSQATKRKHVVKEVLGEHMGLRGGSPLHCHTGACAGAGECRAVQQVAGVPQEGLCPQQP